MGDTQGGDQEGGASNLVHVCVGGEPIVKGCLDILAESGVSERHLADLSLSVFLKVSRQKAD